MVKVTLNTMPDTQIDDDLAGLKAKFILMFERNIGQRDTIRLQQAEIERLRAALEPFAVMFDEFRSTEGVSEIYQYNDAILRYSDFERARRALESEAG